jgi:hypothetical protein
LWRALWKGKVFDEMVGQFVPQFALPVVFKLDKVVLQLVRSSLSLLEEMVGNSIAIELHSHGSGRFCAGRDLEACSGQTAKRLGIGRRYQDDHMLKRI